MSNVIKIICIVTVLTEIILKIIGVAGNTISDLLFTLNMIVVLPVTGITILALLSGNKYQLSKQKDNKPVKSSDQKGRIRIKIRYNFSLSINYFQALVLYRY